MTRLERIAAHLAAHGPQTTKQIAAAFGWPINTASSAISHARTYGYIEAAGLVPNARQTIWRQRPQIIRKPGQGGRPCASPQR